MMGDEGEEDEVGFTASADVPGQLTSRECKPLFEAWLNGLVERNDPEKDNALVKRFHEEFMLLYDELLNEKVPVLNADGEPTYTKTGRPKTTLARDWRKAAYEAWSSLPASLREPKTLTELADRLGLSSPSTIRHWRRKDPEIETRFKERLTQRLLEYAPDVLMAMIAVASDPDSKGHQDRKLFLEMTGMYQPKTKTEVTGEDGESLAPQVMIYIPDNERDADSAPSRATD